MVSGGGDGFAPAFPALRFILPALRFILPALRFILIESRLHADQRILITDPCGRVIPFRVRRTGSQGECGGGFLLDRWARRWRGDLLLPPLRVEMDK